MSRISIDVSAEDHKRLKALAALQGLSLKDYLLRSALPPKGDNEELAELEVFLDERVRMAKAGRVKEKSEPACFPKNDLSCYIHTVNTTACSILSGKMTAH